MASTPSTSRSMDSKPSMMNRFLSRREKDSSGHRRGKSRDTSVEKEKKLHAIRSVVSFSAAFPNPPVKTMPLLGMFYKTIQGTTANPRPSSIVQIRPRSGEGILAIFKTNKVDPQEKPDKEELSKLHIVKARLAEAGHTTVDDEQIEYALGSQHANGDVQKAFDLVVLIQESVNGVIKPYKPEINMLGAENRQYVTCYLDSLLFAMFARLSSFESILCTSFDDEPRRRLSSLIRLWVNMLRDGRLIKVDVTQFLQEALAACGWPDAAQLLQQDVSEAFSFITDQLDLPMLSLKVDIFHNGDANSDDHKVIKERLLDVAIPDEEHGRAVRLEDCLEVYFNNQVAVTRHLERINTMSSSKSDTSTSDEKGGSSQHVEVSVQSIPESRIATPVETPNTPISPSGRRGRAFSILGVVETSSEKVDGDATNGTNEKVGGTQRHEILMPAWQFFNLMPWTTNTSSSNGNDASFATHLSQTSPVLGICLKRYGMGGDGRSFRKNTKVDIPLVMRLPNFIDETLQPGEGQNLNFKLVLQSIVCHRGNSVQSGHYITLIRGNLPPSESPSEDQPPNYSQEKWIKFDDLHDPRVCYVDIEEALSNEMPYLLFYQVVGEPSILPTTQENEPPSYAESAASTVQSTTNLVPEVEKFMPQGYFDGAREDPMPKIRLSIESERSPTPSRTSFNFSEERRGSLATMQTSLASDTSSAQIISAPVTPSEETTAQRLSRAAARFSMPGNRSRPQSQSGISLTLSRLSMMRSKDNLNKSDTQPKEPTEPVPPLPRKEDITEHRPSITIEEPDRSLEHQTKIPETTVERSKSKKEKKRDKSKGPSERSSSDHHHHHHMPKDKEKGKPKSKDENDRECSIM